MIRDNATLATTMSAAALRVVSQGKPPALNVIIAAAIMAALQSRDEADARHIEAIRLRRDRHQRRPWVA